MPQFTVPLHEMNDCHDPETGEFCAKHGLKVGDYAIVDTDNGSRFRIKIRSESEGFLRGVEVNTSGDEIRPDGADERVHLIQKTGITKVAKLVHDKTYGTLVRVPGAPKKRSLKDKKAGVRRMTLARGGVAAEKLRKRDYALARGRENQKAIRAGRKRAED